MKRGIKIQVIGFFGNLSLNSGLMTPILQSSGVMENVNTRQLSIIALLLTSTSWSRQVCPCVSACNPHILTMTLINWILRSRVIEHIQEQHALNDEIGIVYAYLQYDSPETQEPSNLLRAFIKQLCFRKELDPLLLDFFNEYSRDARGPSFERLQSHFIQLATIFTGFFVVIMLWTKRLKSKGRRSSK